LGLQEVWPEVLRAISQFEFLQQIRSGGPTDMTLFAPQLSEPQSQSGLEKMRNRLLGRKQGAAGEWGARALSCFWDRQRSVPMSGLVAVCVLIPGWLLRHFHGLLASFIRWFPSGEARRGTQLLWRNRNQMLC
jgi:hypothetical protein